MKPGEEKMRSGGKKKGTLGGEKESHRGEKGIMWGEVKNYYNYNASPSAISY